jgi:ATP-dependent RNA helicase RhlE
VSFDAFAFHPQIKAGILNAGFATPTPIQSQTIQPVLDGQDVMGLAQTGTGKTAAFVLPILQRLLKEPRGKLRALILSPTRELAEQTHTVIGELGRQTGLRSVTLYGGVSAAPQMKSLRAGVEFAVACPGRLLDLMGQGVVDLRNIQVLVIDEADRMFDMGFLPSIRRILAALPKQRQTLLFSATMPPEIRSLAMDILKKPVTVEIGSSRPVESIRQAVYPVEQEEKYPILLALLSKAGSGQILVFTRTKHRAKKLALQLAKAGHSATSLQGNLSQNQRQIAMDGFRSGRVKVMVATDIAARGIDVTQISHVINYDVPDTADAYTHRIGRTGRMSRLGFAFTLATQDDLPIIRSIERLISRPLERLKAPEGLEKSAAAPTPVQKTPQPAAMAAQAVPAGASAQRRPQMAYQSRSRSGGRR